MTSVLEEKGVRPVRAQHRFDEAALARWMADNVAGYAGVMRVDEFQGGQSNPTYRLSTPRASYVLRRKPPGVLLKGAHAIEREARVMTALGQAGFPVPRVHGLCLDDTVIGSWFYVMNLVEGRIFWDARLPEVAARDRSAYLEAMNATLAQLHRYDPAALGLSDYGRAGGYIARQIERWSQQYLQDEVAGRHASMDRLVAWLPEHIPANDEVAVTHGDFRIDNMIFHPKEPCVVAVLDWELSTLGHPLADFAYNLMMYRVPQEIHNGLLGADLAGMALLTEADYVRAYCRESGRDQLPDLEFYVVFNMFRFAAILHGIRGRNIRGTASSANAQEVGDRFALVADLAWKQVQRL